jgi:hypothetical protein
MDRRVITDKLERLRRCVQRIEHKRLCTFSRTKTTHAEARLPPKLVE